MKIPRDRAKRIVIRAAGIGRKNPFGRGKNAVHRAIKYLSYVQIDTISVINRAHHHTLYNRVPGYTQKFLSKLQSEQKIFEYWSHAAAYLPMEDYRFSLPIKKYFKDRKDPWPKCDSKLMKRVLDRIKAEGPLMARDFQGKKKLNQSGWWSWKPAKLALERLFLEGDLITVGRKGFQKIYDLPERVIPGDVDASMPTKEEYGRYLVLSYLRILGIASVQELCYLRRNVKKDVIRCLGQLMDQGEVVEVAISGLSNQKYYTQKTTLQRQHRVHSKLVILSPFDNLVIQRKRLTVFFDYHYQIECYVPAAKREFGYFCLPLLYGDSFVGRADCKADRKAGVFFISKLYDETFNKIRIPVVEWVSTFTSFARFHNCERLKISHCSNKELEKQLKSAFS